MVGEMLLWYSGEDRGIAGHAAEAWGRGTPLNQRRGGDLLEVGAALAELQCGVVGVDGIAIVCTRLQQQVGTRRPRGCYFNPAKTLKGIHINARPARPATAPARVERSPAPTPSCLARRW